MELAGPCVTESGRGHVREKMRSPRLHAVHRFGWQPFVPGSGRSHGGRASGRDRYTRKWPGTRGRPAIFGTAGGGVTQPRLSPSHSR
jgi:hypothetical protein